MSGYKIYNLQLFDVWHWKELLPDEVWLGTKYLNSNDNGRFDQADTMNAYSDIVFERSILDCNKYVCIKIGEKIKLDRLVQKDLIEELFHQFN